MKKILTLGLLSLSVSGFAATTGTLLLRGTVPRLLEISVNAETIASNLPLDTTQSNTLVAVVNEKSNSKTGYNVSISSANQGKLVHEIESSSVVNYSLNYNGNNVDLVSGQTFTYSGAGANNNNRNVTISYTGIDHDLLIEGEYSDTVTFTIAAN
jgi:hypothetical protein